MFTALTVKPVAQGRPDQADLQQQASGCPLKSKKVRVKKRAGRASLLKYLDNAKLRKGVVVQLRVTHEGTVGRVSTWRMRGSKPPKSVARCVAPGKKKLSRCPRR